MKLWIARDKNGGLYLHFDKPTTDYGKCYFTSMRAVVISRDLFPDVTFENSPQMVELKLVKEE